MNRISLTETENETEMKCLTEWVNLDSCSFIYSKIIRVNDVFFVVENEKMAQQLKM